MSGRSRAAVLPTNIALLQNLVKKDPSAYLEEFRIQYQHYQSLRDLFNANPSSSQNVDELNGLINFVTHVCSCYTKETAGFPVEISTFLKSNHDSVNVELSATILHSMVMLRNRNLLNDEVYIDTVFHVMTRSTSKRLRTLTYSALIQMVKIVNQGHKNMKVNKQVQALLFNLLEKREVNAIWAVKIIRDLWRRGVWDDSRSIEILSQAALHDDVKVAASAIRFFLGADKERDETQQEEEEDDLIDMTLIKHKLKVNKKSSKREKQVDQATRSYKRQIRDKDKIKVHLNFSAIHLLRDPQGFSERLFSRHLANTSGSPATRFTLEQKIDCINLVSRMVGAHKLTLLGLYSFLLKYLTPKQKDVTQFMAAAAQASHDMVPPDVLSPMIRKIADEFVSDGVSPEVAAAGLNTIREILTRAPLSIEETLLHDLIQYRGSKAKAVNMAARGLIGLYREVMPSMLPSKERGKAGTMAVKSGQAAAPKFGDSTAANGFSGLELLQKFKTEQNEDGEENENDGWEVLSDNEDDSESDGGWIQVESDQEYDISDSDDEESKADSEAKKAAAAADAIALAGQEFLTPADFAKLDELKAEAGIRKALGQSTDEIVDAVTLMGNKKFKQNKEERLAQVKEGREDRDTYGSRKRHHAETEHSTTNKQKARKKNFIMLLHKRDVQNKAKKSLRDKQRILRAHINRQKKQR